MEDNPLHPACAVHTALQVIIDVSADWHRVCSEVARAVQNIAVNEHICIRLRVCAIRLC